MNVRLQALSAITVLLLPITISTVAEGDSGPLTEAQLGIVDPNTVQALLAVQKVDDMLDKISNETHSEPRCINDDSPCQIYVLEVSDGALQISFNECQQDLEKCADEAIREAEVEARALVKRLYACITNIALCNLGGYGCLAFTDGQISVARALNTTSVDVRGPNVSVNHSTPGMGIEMSQQIGEKIEIPRGVLNEGYWHFSISTNPDTPGC